MAYETSGKELCFTILVVFSALASARNWPPDSTAKCSQNTKQKAMYGKMIWSPSLRVKQMTSMEVDVEWNDLEFNPISNPQKRGGVYVSYTTGVKGGPGGYFGVQIHANGGSFLFSFWDQGRFTGSGHNKTPKKATNMVWPADMTRCKRNCQDCALPDLVKWKKLGLTTGTQCSFRYSDMKVGDKYKVILRQTNSAASLDTRKYGGMPEALKKLGEKDGIMTGGLWEVKVLDLKRNKKINVGTMMMAGDGSGMERLGTFDEMIGCNKCNAVQHKDTRYGLKVIASDGSVRYPTKMEGLTRAGESTCKKYSIKGSKSDFSISFEGGPFTTDIFPTGRYQPVW